MDKAGDVWDEPITQEEDDIVERTMEDHRYAGEHVLIYEGRVAEHCEDPYEFGELTYKYRGKRTFAVHVPKAGTPKCRIGLLPGRF